MENNGVSRSKRKTVGGGWFASISFFSLSLVLVGILGGLFGMGTFTFIYAEGYSYFSDNPDACVNCHIMRDVYDRWNHSSHKAVAVCNDCHSPHRYPDAYIVKAINGWNHSVAFTTGDFPDPIQITQLNREVALENCIYCHGDFVIAIESHAGEDPSNCLRCHAGVGHPR